jgi:hypothetical protein
LAIAHFEIPLPNLEVIHWTNHHGRYAPLVSGIFQGLGKRFRGLPLRFVGPHLIWADEPGRWRNEPKDDKISFEAIDAGARLQIIATHRNGLSEKQLFDGDDSPIWPRVKALIPTRNDPSMFVRRKQA